MERMMLESELECFQEPTLLAQYFAKDSYDH